MNFEPYTFETDRCKGCGSRDKAYHWVNNIVSSTYKFEWIEPESPGKVLGTTFWFCSPDCYARAINKKITQDWKQYALGRLPDEDPDFIEKTEDMRHDETYQEKIEWYRFQNENIVKNAEWELQQELTEEFMAEVNRFSQKALAEREKELHEEARQEEKQRKEREREEEAVRKEEIRLLREREAREERERREQLRIEENQRREIHRQHESERRAREAKERLEAAERRELERRAIAERREADRRAFWDEKERKREEEKQQKIMEEQEKVEAEKRRWFVKPLSRFFK
jgi:hypothetical protein